MKQEKQLKLNSNLNKGGDLKISSCIPTKKYKKAPSKINVKLLISTEYI